MKVGDWVRFNYSGLVGMVTHVDEHDCTVQLNGGYRKVLSRGEVQVIEPTEPARTEAHMDKQERGRLRALAQAATPGPWIVNQVDDYDGTAYIESPAVDAPYRDDGCYIAQTGYDNQSYCERPAPFSKTADGEFIAAANPDAVLRLLAERDALEQRAEAAERDAARYRRLREGIADADGRHVLGVERVGGGAPPIMLLREALDAAVDAAMGEGGGT